MITARPVLRRRRSVVLVAACGLLLAACGGSGGGGAAEDADDPGASATDEVTTTAAAVGTAPSCAGPDATGRGGEGTVEVCGTVWHDLDADGVRDEVEPGLPGVVIARDGTGVRAETDAGGVWRLQLPPGPVTLIALTGWLPSVCTGDLDCDARRTADQDFASENQYVRARIEVPADDPLVDVDLGLEPDHGDPTGAEASAHAGNDRGDGPALAHDLAVRHSSIGGYEGCADPDGTRTCPVGTALPSLVQLYNQGTEPATGVRFVLTVPPGTELTADPTPDPNTPGAVVVRTGASGTTGSGATWVEFAVDAPLPPATAVWLRAGYRVTGGPASPPPAAGAKYDRHAYVSIVAADDGDDDAPLDLEPADGRDGEHNVNLPAEVDDDTSDAIDFNVA